LSFLVQPDDLRLFPVARFARPAFRLAGFGLACTGMALRCSDELDGRVAMLDVVPTHEIHQPLACRIQVRKALKALAGIAGTVLERAEESLGLGALIIG